jgi:aminoglycoside 2''-phosphotransferase
MDGMMANMSDPAVSPQELLGKIVSCFPEVQWGTYRYIDEGWDHGVIILDNNLVFRFPLDQEYQALLEHEIAILEFLRGKVAVRIPRYRYVAPAHAFAGYDIIPGTQLTTPVFNNLAPDDYDCLVTQIADFLSVLHTLDTHVEPISSTSPSYLPDDQAEVRKSVQKDLLPILNPEDYRIVQEIMTTTDNLLLQTLPAVFIHNDLYGRHMLWDEQAKRLGVIDFSDRCLGDPAVDFNELYEFGAQFVHDVYRHYTGPKDDNFLERAWKYQRWAGVYMMTDYFDNHKTTFAIARQTFDRIKSDSIEPTVA